MRAIINATSSKTLNPGTVLENLTTAESLESESALKKIAIVMRAVDPIHECTLQRVLAISELLADRKYCIYTFFILLDQSDVNRTTAASLQSYFNEHNASQNLRPPEIFGVSEDRVRSEFPAFSNGYMAAKLVDGTYAAVSNRPWLWQLLVPTIAMFSHYHSEFAHTWVFEDDVWSIGTPLMESFRRWDEVMDRSSSSTDLAALRTKRNGIPYNMEMQQKHTQGFEKILTLMKTSIKQQKQWKRLLSRDNQKRSSHWTHWDAASVPNWACVSDAIYRHSHSFSEYLYAAISKNIYQFAECFQQPLAWWGNFTITDVQALLNETERASYSWEHGLVNKITRTEATRRFEARKDIATLLYHGISSHKMNWVGQGKDMQLGLVWNKLESDCGENPFKSR
ncbi:unnamed protein product [Cylindrotheca closterium]|uniref:Uncharacterized protein n=1 Tax=Cylindrotheca closterium TaxID=2856 RepID=A0AAD2PWP1_9STRA|nr:unnamed protein product [Cylindrotheca closterium]